MNKMKTQRRALNDDNNNKNNRGELLPSASLQAFDAIPGQITDGGGR